MIRTIPGYLPKKPTILALAVALNLSVDETNNLLRSAGMALSNSNKQDVIVEYFLSVSPFGRNQTEVSESPMTMLVFFGSAMPSGAFYSEV